MELCEKDVENRKPEYWEKAIKRYLKNSYHYFSAPLLSSLLIPTVIELVILVASHIRGAYRHVFGYK